APGVWYRRNEFAPDTAIGKDPGCEYFWRMETCYALPLFAMQHIASGETVALSRWAADTRSRMPRSSPPEERAKRNRILDGLLEPVKQSPSAEKIGKHCACIEKMKSRHGLDAFRLVAESVFSQHGEERTNPWSVSELREWKTASFRGCRRRIPASPVSRGFRMPPRPWARTVGGRRSRRRIGKACSRRMSFRPFPCRFGRKSTSRTFTRGNGPSIRTSR